MSIVIGIKAKDAIVFASDSQTTTMGSEGLRKTLNAKKIHLIKFKKDQVIVAETGHSTYSNRAIEFFHQMAEEVEISDHRTVAEMAEEAIRRVRATIAQAHPL